MKKIVGILVIMFLGAVYMCANSASEKAVRVVKPFELQKYLGKWYEIARFDVFFERDLVNVTAIYSLNANGSVRVDNQGCNAEKKKKSQAVGKAKFVGNSDEARLKVSFFGPFYAPYNVVKLDSEYKYALVVGNNKRYLWILSRTKTIPEDVKKSYLDKAKEMGFDVTKLIWTQQN
jgi:Bacterial lipocalin